MNTSPTSSPDTGAIASPFSVSLKINATSVMLYRNIYLKGTGDQRGLSAQEYLCSFSLHVELELELTRFRGHIWSLGFRPRLFRTLR